MLGHVPKRAQPMVRGALKQIFAAPDRETTGRRSPPSVTSSLSPAGKVARLLAEAEEELLAYMRFPTKHWPNAACAQACRACVEACRTIR